MSTNPRESPYLQRPPPGYEFVRDGTTASVLAHEAVESSYWVSVLLIVLGIIGLAGGGAAFALLDSVVRLAVGSLGIALFLLCIGASLFFFKVTTTRIGFDSLSVRVTTRNPVLRCMGPTTVEHLFSNLVVVPPNPGNSGKATQYLDMDFSKGVELTFAQGGPDPRTVRMGSFSEEATWAKAPWSNDDTVSAVELAAFWRGYTNYLRHLAGLPELVLHADTDEDTVVTLPKCHFYLRRNQEDCIAPLQRLQSTLEVVLGVASAGAVGTAAGSSNLVLNGEETTPSTTNGCDPESEIAQVVFSSVFFMRGTFIAYFFALLLFSSSLLFFSVGRLFTRLSPTLSCVLGSCAAVIFIVAVVGMRLRCATIDLPSLMTKPAGDLEAHRDVSARNFPYFVPCCVSAEATATVDWSNVVVERSDIATFHGLGNANVAAPPTANVMMDAPAAVAAAREQTEPAVASTSVIMMEHHSQVPEYPSASPAAPQSASITQEGTAAANAGGDAARANWESFLVGPPAGLSASRGAGVAGGVEPAESKPQTRLRMVVSDTVAAQVIIAVEVTNFSGEGESAGVATTVIPITPVSPDMAASSARRFERMFVGLSLLAKRAT